MPACAQVYVHVQSQARSSYHLGYYPDEEAAARAYDREILKVGRLLDVPDFDDSHGRLFEADVVLSHRPLHRHLHGDAADMHAIT